MTYDEEGYLVRPSDFDDPDEMTEWPDREGVLERLEAWDGKHVDDIIDDVRELVANGSDIDIMEAPIAQSRGQLPADLIDHIKLVTVDDHQGYILVDDSGQIQWGTWDNMLTEPVLETWTNGRLKRWLREWREVVELGHETQERMPKEVAALRKNASGPAIRLAALQAIRNSDHQYITATW